MGINEQIILKEILSGHIHAHEIAEHAHLSPPLVKACLVSLIRRNILQYRDGYQVYSVTAAPPKKAKPKMKYKKSDPPQSLVIEQVMRESGRPMSSQELSKITGFMNQCVRSCLSLMGRRERVVAIGTGHRAKVYRLA